MSIIDYLDHESPAPGGWDMGSLYEDDVRGVLIDASGGVVSGDPLRFGEEARS